MRVRRLTTDDGETLLGFLASPIEALEMRAQGSDDTPSLGTQALYELLVSRQASATLANQWRLKSRKVHGTHRIEIKGPTHSAHKLLQNLGVRIDLIDYTARYHVPDENTLKRLTKRWPLRALHKAQ